jgi:hypothetical protein
MAHRELVEYRNEEFRNPHSLPAKQGSLAGGAIRNHKASHILFIFSLLSLR